MSKSLKEMLTEKMAESASKNVKPVVEAVKFKVGDKAKYDKATDVATVIAVGDSIFGKQYQSVTLQFADGKVVDEDTTQSALKKVNEAAEPEDGGDDGEPVVEAVQFLRTSDSKLMKLDTTFDKMVASMRDMGAKVQPSRAHGRNDMDVFANQKFLGTIFKGKKVKRVFANTPSVVSYFDGELSDVAKAHKAMPEVDKIEKTKNGYDVYLDGKVGWHLIVAESAEEDEEELKENFVESLVVMVDEAKEKDVEGEGEFAVGTFVENATFQLENANRRTDFGKEVFGEVKRKGRIAQVRERHPQKRNQDRFLVGVLASDGFVPMFSHPNLEGGKKMAGDILDDWQRFGVSLSRFKADDFKTPLSEHIGIDELSFAEGYDEPDNDLYSPKLDFSALEAKDFTMVVDGYKPIKMKWYTYSTQKEGYLSWRGKTTRSRGKKEAEMILHINPKGKIWKLVWYDTQIPYFTPFTIKQGKKQFTEKGLVSNKSESAMFAEGVSFKTNEKGKTVRDLEKSPYTNNDIKDIESLLSKKSFEKHHDILRKQLEMVKVSIKDHEGKKSIEELGVVYESVDLTAFNERFSNAKQFDFKAMLRTYKRREENNDHMGNYKMLAQIFGTKADQELYDRIEQSYQKKRHLTITESDLLYNALGKYYHELVKLSKGVTESLFDNMCEALKDGIVISYDDWKDNDGDNWEINIQWDSSGKRFIAKHPEGTEVFKELDHAKEYISSAGNAKNPKVKQTVESLEVYENKSDYVVDVKGKKAKFNDAGEAWVYINGKVVAKLAKKGDKFALSLDGKLISFDSLDEVFTKLQKRFDKFLAESKKTILGLSSFVANKVSSVTVTNEGDTTSITFKANEAFRGVVTVSEDGKSSFKLECGATLTANADDFDEVTNEARDKKYPIWTAQKHTDTQEYWADEDKNVKGFFKKGEGFPVKSHTIDGDNITFTLPDGDIIKAKVGEFSPEKKQVESIEQMPDCEIKTAFVEAKSQISTQKLSSTLMENVVAELEANAVLEYNNSLESNVDPMLESFLMFIEGFTKSDNKFDKKVDKNELERTLKLAIKKTDSENNAVITQNKWGAIGFNFLKVNAEQPKVGEFYLRDKYQDSLVKVLKIVTAADKKQVSESRVTDRDMSDNYVRRTEDALKDTYKLFDKEAKRGGSDIRPDEQYERLIRLANHILKLREAIKKKKHPIVD